MRPRTGSSAADDSTFRGRRAAAGLLLALLAAPAAAHRVAPEAVVAGATSRETKAAWGVEDAYRDEKAPRLLVIRVGPRWYARSAAARREQAAAWWGLWRASVPQGVVSIVDVKSGAPVVQFGRGGEVVGVAPAPAP